MKTEAFKMTEENEWWESWLEEWWEADKRYRSARSPGGKAWREWEEDRREVWIKPTREGVKQILAKKRRLEEEEKRAKERLEELEREGWERICRGE